ncbi:hypothetical protein [Streptomyces sp. T028]|uniref:hypothetical protein n=1 Tax=Streptomyces sp. T028 TaxID=3394379 RepID=UPI003A86C95D
MTHSHTLPPHIQEALTALEQREAEAAARAAEEAAANNPEPEETKPPGYYATCSREEFQAELRRQGITLGGHGLKTGA